MRQHDSDPSSAPNDREPPAPGSRAAHLLAVLKQFEQSQWRPPEQIARRQFRQLTGLLGHALATIPYYREKLAATGIRPGASLSWESWRRIPLLTRRDIQDAGRLLMSERLPPEHGRLVAAESSGSTGIPVTTVSTEVTRFFWDAFTLRDHLWHRRDFTKKLAAIRSAGDNAQYPGKQAANWGSASSAAGATGPGSVLDIRTDIRLQAEWLRREDPDYLLTYPSNLKALAAIFAAEGKRPDRLREILTIGEVVTPELRRLCREAWGVPIADIYSAVEVGYVALQCPDHEQYHVQSENVLVEIIDENGRPCGPGEIGRVVVTSLHNFAMPLIRYELGDYAEAGTLCPCGRGLPVLRKILGRVRNMLTLPSGTRHWPFLGENSFRAVAPIRQYQIVQHSLAQIEAKIVADRPLTGEEEERLRGIIVSELGYPFPVRFSYPDAIPRSRGGKFEDFISLL